MNREGAKDAKEIPWYGISPRPQRPLRWKRFASLCSSDFCLL